MSTLPRYIRKGRALPIGTIRTHGGVKKKKTAQGWVPVKEGAKKKPKKKPVKEGAKKKPKKPRFVVGDIVHLKDSVDDRRHSGRVLSVSEDGKMAEVEWTMDTGSVAVSTRAIRRMKRGASPGFVKPKNLYKWDSSSGSIQKVYLAAPKKTSQRIVRDDDSFEKHAEELAAQIGPGLIVTSGYSHKAGGGAIGWHGFEVGLSPANLKRALGNKPDARKTEALVEQVVSEFSVNEPGSPEHYPRDWVEEDIRGSASRSGVRARQEIKLISAALAVAVRETKAHTALGHNDDRQGHIRALEILAEHFGRDK